VIGWVEAGWLSGDAGLGVQPRRDCVEDGILGSSIAA